MEGAQNKKFRRTRFNWIKYLIWIPWVFMLLFLFWKTGGVNAVDFTYMTVSGISVSDVPSLIIFIIVSLVFFILPSSVRKKGCLPYDLLDGSVHDRRQKARENVEHSVFAYQCR